MKPLSSAVVRTASLVDRWHWLLVLAASPFLLFPSAGTAPMLLILPLIWMAGLVAKREPFPRTPLNLALAVLCAMVLVSEWATFDLMWSLPKITGMVLGLGLFYALVREGQAPRGWWLGFLLFLGIGFGIAALGLLGTHWATKNPLLAPIISRLSLRIIGLPGAEDGFNPNYVAGALLWVIPSLLTFSWLLLTRANYLQGLLGRGRAGVLIVLTGGATLWTIAILILTQSRGGYIGLALTLLAMVLVALPPRWRRYTLATLALLAIILGVVLASHWEGVRAWVMGSALPADPALSLNTLDGRLELWSRAIYGIQDFPFTGMGMNTFRRVAPVLYPLFLVSPDKDIGHAHNEFLQAALDLGIPGLIAFTALYVVAFWMLIRTWQSARVNAQRAPSEERAAVPLNKPSAWSSVLGASPFADAHLVQITVMGLGGGLLAHMVYGLTDAVALGAKPGVLFWMLLGLITGLYQRVRTWEHSPRAVSVVESRSP